MSDFYYPDLDPATMKAIGVIQKLAYEHPAYWLSAPYSGAIQMQLEGLFNAKSKRAPDSRDAPPADTPPLDDRDDWQFLSEETKTLYRDLKAAKPAGDEPAAQMGYFRTATSLLEKLLAMNERAQNLKQVSDFYAGVLEVMDSTLTTGQRTEVMTKLEALAKGN